MNIQFLIKNPRKDALEGIEEKEIKVFCTSKESRIETSIIFDEFRKALSQSGKYSAVDQKNAYFKSEGTTLQLDTNVQHDSVNFKGLKGLNTLLENQGINLVNTLRTEGEQFLVIESNEDSILSLPWESLIEDIKKDKIRFVRKVITGDTGQGPKDHNNFLFLLSHGFMDGHKEMHRVGNDFEKEVPPILALMFGDNVSSETKPQLFHVVKYLNRDIFSKLDVDIYNNLHLILHGRENGDIGFEDIDDHRQLSWFSPEEFIDKLKDFEPRDLIFLSCCYSGYGTSSQPSLAFQIIAAGLANAVVAFNGGIGSQKTSPKFALDFYDVYMQSCDPINSFHSAVTNLINLGSVYWDKPVIYTGSLI